MSNNNNFNKIDLRVLAPIDIACSKISRLSDLDLEDIISCIKYGKITKSDLTDRANQYSRVGNDQIFEENLKYVIKTCFK